MAEFCPHLYPHSSWQSWDARQRWGCCGVNIPFYYSDKNLISVKYLGWFCVRNILFTQQLGWKWSSSHTEDTLGSEIHCLVNGCNYAGFWMLIHLCQQIYWALVAVSWGCFLVQSMAPLKSQGKLLPQNMLPPSPISAVLFFRIFTFSDGFVSSTMFLNVVRFEPFQNNWFI